ncbi:MAG: hypothetical protein LBI82_13115 [Dysgonamonadaceae bacterium]|jgi:uncharacterized protein with PQ loop repeat|nr:hypothetical protein [Dysgonamonadaceae bacterium]
MPPFVVEIIGYLASAFLVMSFAFNKNVVKLRIMSAIGCVLFVVYGFLLHAYPMVIANVIIVGINMYYLFFKKKSS